jgi:hypothetical protein
MRPNLTCLFAVLATFGCQFDSAIPATSMLTCSEQQPICPPEYFCSTRLNRCLSTGGDRDAPVAQLVKLTPATGTVGTRFVFSFETNEALLTTPIVSAVFGRGERLEFAPVSEIGNLFTFELLVPPTARSGSGPLSVELFDLAGNAGTLSNAPSVLLDTDGPKPSSASLSLIALAGSALSNPSKLGTNVRGELSFIFDEPVVGVPKLKAIPDIVSIQKVGTTCCRFELRAQNSGEEISVALSVEATDALGNTRQTSLTVTPELFIDTLPPSPPTNLVYDRRPAGSLDAGPTPVARVTGMTAGNSIVRSLSQENGAPDSSLEISRTRSEANGQFTLDVPGVERAAIAIEAVDEGGNRSIPNPRYLTRLTFSPKIPGVLSESVGSAGPGLTRLDARTINSNLLGFDDGANATVFGESSYRQTLADSDVQGNCALVSDEHRSTVVSFGGGGTTSFASEQTEFNGHVSKRSDLVPAPTPRSAANFAVDRSTGRMCLFGGVDETDVWEWDGVSWRNFLGQQDGPKPRSHAAMASDAKGLLLLGGREIGSNPPVPLNDAWQRVDRIWTQVDAGELNLTTVSAAYNPKTGNTLVISQPTDGGRTETYEWNGLVFTPLQNVGEPPAAGGPLVIDPETGIAYLFTTPGGVLAAALWKLDSTWQYVAPSVASIVPPAGGGAWLARSREVIFCPAFNRGYMRYSPDTNTFNSDFRTLSVRPPSRFNATYVNDAFGKMFVFGGNTSSAGYNADMWAWADGGWTALDAGAEMIAKGTSSTVAFDDGGFMTLLGHTRGALASVADPRVVQFSGGTWSSFSPSTDAGPAPRLSASNVVLLAGEPWLVSDSPTWKFTNGAWANTGASPFVLRRADSLILQRPGENSFALLGGTPSAPSAYYSATLQSDAGLSWRTIDGGNLPIFRRSNSMTTFDPQRKAHLIFAGRDTTVGNTYSADMYAVEVDAGIITSVVQLPYSDAEGDGSPSRAFGGFWFDQPTNSIQIFGGLTKTGSVPNDQWVFETSIHKPSLQLRVPVPLNFENKTGTIRLHAKASGRAGNLNGPNGAELWIWRESRFVKVAQNTSAIPSVLEFEIRNTSLRPFVAASGILGLRITSVGANGSGSARIDVDSIEIQLEY